VAAFDSRRSPARSRRFAHSTERFGGLRVNQAIFVADWLLDRFDFGSHVVSSHRLMTFKAAS